MTLHCNGAIPTLHARLAVRGRRPVGAEQLLAYAAESSEEDWGMAGVYATGFALESGYIPTLGAYWGGNGLRGLRAVAWPATERFPGEAFILTQPA